MSHYNFLPYKNGFLYSEMKSCVSCKNIDEAVSVARFIKQQGNYDFVKVSKHITQV